MCQTTGFYEKGREYNLIEIKIQTCNTVEPCKSSLFVRGSAKQCDNEPSGTISLKPMQLKGIHLSFTSVGNDKMAFTTELTCHNVFCENDLSLCFHRHSKLHYIYSVFFRDKSLIARPSSSVLPGPERKGWLYQLSFC